MELKVDAPPAEVRYVNLPVKVVKKGKDDFSFSFTKQVSFQRAISETIVPANYDYSQPTCLNYCVKDSREVIGDFADIRSTLDFDYHGCYDFGRQKIQDRMLRDCIGSGTVHEYPWIIFTAGAMGAGKGHVIRFMSREGHFPLPDIVSVDPDKFRTELPEWPGYLDRDPNTAGYLTHRESGYCVEIAQEAALRASKNVWIDGSLRDADWYTKVFADIRERHPRYRIAIIHVYASWDTVRRRAAARASETGRVVPPENLRSSFEQVPGSVERLGPLADFVAHIANDDEPTLTVTCRGSTCQANAVGDWGAIRARFATLVTLRGSPKQREPSVRAFRETVARLLADHSVVVFSKSYCSYCKRVKKILAEEEQAAGLQDLGIHVVELDAAILEESAADLRRGREVSDGALGVAMQMELTRLTGQDTVPLVFIEGKHVGGFEEVEALQRSGELAPRLLSAAASVSLARGDFL